VKSNLNCHCGLPPDYDGCCGRLHQGEPAADAESLMRSRYSAFVLGNRAYLLASWHPHTRPAQLALDDPDDVRWLGLSVKRHEITGADTAIVEFIARYRAGGGSAVRLHEVSRFVRVEGRWLYLDGEG